MVTSLSDAVRDEHKLHTNIISGCRFSVQNAVKYFSAVGHPIFETDSRFLAKTAEGI